MCKSVDNFVDKQYFKKVYVLIYLRGRGKDNVFLNVKKNIKNNIIPVNEFTEFTTTKLLKKGFKWKSAYLRLER